MTNKKTEFESKGAPRELITDNGNGYQNKQVVRGDSKDLVERYFQKTKKIIGDGYQGDKPEENKR
jgi:hypothetical protein